MKYGQSLAFMIKEEDWLKKLVVGTCFTILLPLGVGVIALAGWGLGIAKRVIHHEEQKLPKWSNLGEILQDGLKALAVIFIWFFPAGLLLLVPVILQIFAQLFGKNNINPLVLNDTIAFWIYFAGLLYCIYAGIMTPVGLGLLARSGSVKRAIKPTVIWLFFLTRKLRYLTLFLVLIFLGIFLTLFGASLCLVGLFPVWAYTITVIGHLLGQAGLDEENPI